jgi:hypothetical protein
VRHHDQPSRAEGGPARDRLGDGRRRHVEKRVAHVGEAVGLVDEPRQLRQLGVGAWVRAPTREHDHDVAGGHRAAGEAAERLASAITEDAGQVARVGREGHGQRGPARSQAGRRRAHAEGRLGVEPEGQEGEPGDAVHPGTREGGGQRLAEALQADRLDRVADRGRQPGREPLERGGRFGLYRGEQEGAEPVRLRLDRPRARPRWHRPTRR